MTEANEMTGLVQEMRQLAAETKALREKLAEQDKLVATLSKRIQKSEQVSQPAATAGTSPTRVANLPTSRRKMLKAGIMAAGMAATSVAATAGPLAALADAGKKGITPTADGVPITVAGSVAPSSATSNPTQVYNPSSSQLSPLLFWINNYTTHNWTFPSDYRIALAGTVSGTDTTDDVPIGVYGGAETGYGVYGTSTNIGVIGTTTADFALGMMGYSTGAAAYGVYGVGTNGIGGAFSGASNLYLAPGGLTPLSRTNSHLVGEIIVDQNNSAWICVNGGKPGTWRQLAGTDTAGSFHALAAPVRVLDTRTSVNIAKVIASNKGGTPAAIFANGEARTYSLSGANSPIPAGATAFSAALTSVNINMTSTQSGYFQTWTGALSPVPIGSVVTYNVAGKANSGFFTSALTDTRQFNLYTLHGTDVIIDITGYYL